MSEESINHSDQGKNWLLYQESILPQDNNVTTIKLFCSVRKVISQICQFV